VACEVLEKKSLLSKLIREFEDREGFPYEKHENHFAVGYSGCRLQSQRYNSSKLASYSRIKSFLRGTDVRHTHSFWGL